MFKNRAFQVKLVNVDDHVAPDSTTEYTRITLDEATKLIQDNAKYAAIGFVGIYAAVKTLNSIAEIAVHIATKS